jgi:hypothetical protein
MGNVTAVMTTFGLSTHGSTFAYGCFSYRPITFSKKGSDRPQRIEALSFVATQTIRDMFIRRFQEVEYLDSLQMGL